jgi:hypothetical protein
LVVAASMRVCSAVAPEVYTIEVKFVIERLGAVGIYPCPNRLVVVCCGTKKVGVKPSMVVQLWKWFTDWIEGLAIDVLPADAPFVCRLV